jgi:hypothetical protein
MQRLRVLIAILVSVLTSLAFADEPESIAIERAVEAVLKKKADEKKAADDAAKQTAEAERLDALFGGTSYDLLALYHNTALPDSPTKKWYDRFSFRGYTQLRAGNTVQRDPEGAEPFLFNDRFINGNAENFGIRRARFILFGDVSDYLSLYAQVDLANALPFGTNAHNGQMRDLYGDAYFDRERVHRLRIGLSKVPYGFENMQSSQNRVSLDRSDALRATGQN